MKQIIYIFIITFFFIQSSIAQDKILRMRPDTLYLVKSDSLTAYCIYKRHVNKVTFFVKQFNQKPYYYSGNVNNEHFRFTDDREYYTNNINYKLNKNNKLVFIRYISEEGNICGNFYTFFDNGNISHINTYNARQVLDGESFIVLKRGRVYVSSMYKNGALNGISRNYFWFGRLSDEITYRDNRKNGYYYAYWFFPNFLWQKNHFTNDTLNGKCFRFSIFGKVKQIKIYKDEKLITCYPPLSKRIRKSWLEFDSHSLDNYTPGTKDLLKEEE